jgi:hypothetical protein
MVFATDWAYPIGHRFDEAESISDGKITRQPFIVVGEATFDDWVVFATEQRGRPPTEGEIRRIQMKQHFYKISTD